MPIGDELIQGLEGQRMQGPVFLDDVQDRVTDVVRPEAMGQRAPRRPEPPVELSSPFGIEPEQGEEMGRLGRALQRFGEAVSTPGFQEFLGALGAGISPEGGVGERLGQFGVQQAQARLSQDFLQQLERGASPGEIEQAGVISPEARRAAMEEFALQREAEMAERRQAFEEDVTERRLGFEESRVGLEEERVEMEGQRTALAFEQFEAGRDDEQFARDIALGRMDMERLRLQSELDLADIRAIGMQLDNRLKLLELESIQGMEGISPEAAIRQIDVVSQGLDRITTAEGRAETVIAEMQRKRQRLESKRRDSSSDLSSEEIDAAQEQIDAAIEALESVRGGAHDTSARMVRRLGSLIDQISETGRIEPEALDAIAPPEAGSEEAVGGETEEAGGTINTPDTPITRAHELMRTLREGSVGDSLHAVDPSTNEVKLFRIVDTDDGRMIEEVR